MHITKYRLRSRYAYIKAMLMSLFCYLLLMNGYITFESTGENLFHVFVNGTEVGTVTDVAVAEELLVDARREVASGSTDLVFMEADMSFQGEELLWGHVDKQEQVRGNMLSVLEDSVIQAMRRSYTVKVNEYTVNLDSREAVKELLQAAVSKYDTEGSFEIALEQGV